MKKKVINGWVSRSCTTPGDVTRWDASNDGALLWGGSSDVFKTKGKKSDWYDWPPKKVKITIELED